MPRRFDTEASAAAPGYGYASLRRESAGSKWHLCFQAGARSTAAHDGPPHPAKTAPAPPNKVNRRPCRCAEQGLKKLGGALQASERMSRSLRLSRPRPLELRPCRSGVTLDTLHQVYKALAPPLSGHWFRRLGQTARSSVYAASAGFNPTRGLVIA